MGTITVDESSVDQIIATDEVLTGIKMVTAPTQYGPEHFCLMSVFYNPPEVEGGDPVKTQEYQLFNIHISTSSITAGSELMTGGNSRFSNLVVKSIPPGCSFELTTEPLPAQQSEEEEE